MTDKLPILIRSLRETDIAFIRDSWANVLRFKSPSLCWVPAGVILSRYLGRVVLDEDGIPIRTPVKGHIARSGGVIDRLLDKRPDLFRVLVNEENEDQIFGWVCGDKRVTHFVYVKEDFRREGLASRLIDGVRGIRWARGVYKCEDCTLFRGIDGAKNKHRTGFCKIDDREVGKTKLACKEPWVFSHWTRDCERIGRILYRPSLFQEVIRGIDQAVGDSSPQTDKHLRQAGTHVAGRKSGQTEVQPAGV